MLVPNVGQVVFVSWNAQGHDIILWSTCLFRILCLNNRTVSCLACRTTRLTHSSHLSPRSSRPVSCLSRWITRLTRNPFPFSVFRCVLRCVLQHVSVGIRLEPHIYKPTQILLSCFLPQLRIICRVYTPRPVLRCPTHLLSSRHSRPLVSWQKFWLLVINIDSTPVPPISKQARAIPIATFLSLLVLL
jgi:hypothetical protein